MNRGNLSKITRDAGEYADLHHEEYGGWIYAERHRFATLIASAENARVLALLDSHIEQTVAQAAALALEGLSAAEPVALLNSLRLLREAVKL